MSRVVFVVGHRGMLGRDVRRHLAERGHAVATTDARFRGGSGDDLVEAVVQSGADVVVNCAGAIPSKVSDPEEMFRANVVLPQQLGARLGSRQLLIHASSDAVYDGALGQYSRDDPPNATDTYGLSKRLGELVMHLVPTVVIRTSVVGMGGGLLAWLLEQQGDIDGYTNHRWNGITTLEWARACGDLIDREEPRSRVEHVTSGDAVSKFDLLETAVEVFGLPVRVKPTSSPQTLDRALVPTIERPAIRQQLEDLRDWERAGS